jgi:hypothetical protein
MTFDFTIFNSMRIKKIETVNYTLHEDYILAGNKDSALPILICLVITITKSSGRL